MCLAYPYIYFNKQKGVHQATSVLVLARTPYWKFYFNSTLELYAYYARAQSRFSIELLCTLLMRLIYLLLLLFYKRQAKQRKRDVAVVVATIIVCDSVLFRHGDHVSMRFTCAIRSGLMGLVHILSINHLYYLRTHIDTQFTKCARHIHFKQPWSLSLGTTKVFARHISYGSPHPQPESDPSSHSEHTDQVVRVDYICFAIQSEPSSVQSLIFGVQRISMGYFTRTLTNRREATGIPH